MPRKKRQESSTWIYHWIIRGTNKKDLFHQPADYQRFLELALEYKTVFSVTICRYYLMTNYIHTLLQSRRGYDLRHRPSDPLRNPLHRNRRIRRQVN